MADSMAVTLEQQKVISHPFRSAVITLLSKTPMTAKQVANYFDKSTGSTHYHIQQLFTHGILDIDHTNSVNGITEKYYRAKATHFHLINERPTKAVIQKVQALPLSKNELTELNQEISALFLKYANKSASGQRIEHQITFSIEPKDSTI